MFNCGCKGKDFIKTTKALYEKFHTNNAFYYYKSINITFSKYKNSSYNINMENISTFAAL